MLWLRKAGGTFKTLHTFKQNKQYRDFYLLIFPNNQKLGHSSDCYDGCVFDICFCDKSDRLRKV